MSQTNNPWQPAPQLGMTPAPFQTPPDVQRKQDEDHLNLLTIAHYIMGGLTALGSCVFLIHFFMGLAMVTNPHFFDSPKGAQASSGGPPPAFMGYLFMGLGGGAVVVGWLLGGLTIYAGLCIARRRALIFCQIIAGLNCLHMPLGTILGIFTILALNRPTVKAMFDGTASFTPSLTPAGTDPSWYRDSNSVDR